jgi:aminoglycoside 6-adenylyltransferase
VVRDVHPFSTDRDWIRDFGEILAAYWDPIARDPDSGFEQSGNVVQYAGALKIDFGLWPVEKLAWLNRLPSLPAELDAGYRVLLNKDGLAETLGDPTCTGYIPTRPDKPADLTNVNDFFIGVPYVAKCLLRDEVLPAKWCLDHYMRYVYLLPMLEWRMECDHDWSVSPGVNGKGLRKRLPPAIWNELEGTYAGAGIEDNWNALFRLVGLFRHVARHLGYTYPEDLDRRVMEHVQHMRDGLPACDTGSIDAP